ncbi:uncharacterized protein GIQ15_04308 [Arthroderma uncinatum]|uniref:uncharacterized protein n=1 Tax=Arthroderma uncinatum TaxID=74035 RepID=UPI00144A96ED|nr:uncharacterized protein GIQ15_04308 [Arthroderma uncinatum]KAF3481549.1 hypothetical protein GIQ15_04308 [Arthroderma uncinatum]
MSKSPEPSKGCPSCEMECCYKGQAQCLIEALRLAVQGNAVRGAVYEKEAGLRDRVSEERDQRQAQERQAQEERMVALEREVVTLAQKVVALEQMAEERVALMVDGSRNYDEQPEGSTSDDTEDDEYFD